MKFLSYMTKKQKTILPFGIAMMALSANFCLAQPMVSQNYILEKIHERVNTPQYDEITPVVSIDGKSLYFTRVGSPDFCRTIAIDGKDVATNYSPRQYEQFLAGIYGQIQGIAAVSKPFQSDLNQDIWFAETHHSLFDRVLHPDAPLNNALPNSICSLTPDPLTFVVVNQFPQEGGMNKGFSLIQRRISEMDDWNDWADPQPMNIDTYNTAEKSVSLTMSGDGKILILSLPAADSYGDNDLYISFKTGENQWSAPKNMGSTVNSSGREITPHLSADGNYLYFASKRSGSQGLDLYFSARLGAGWDEWMTPRRLLEPINSSGDDSQPYFNAATGYLYFSSKREGSSDIFRVKMADPKPQSFILKGKIVHAQTKNLTDARVLYGDASSSYEWETSSKKGCFEVKIEQGKTIKMTTFKHGFINHEIELNYDKNTYYADNQEITLYVDSVGVGSTITLNPIYFEQSKPYIMKKSFETLDKLVDILKTHRTIKIRVEGHTDNQGKQLQELSEARAREVRNYLIRSKVDAKRVEAIGFGATQPVSANTTDATRRLNRRVEVKIIQTDTNK
jgi:outer membrane protein OmpA-like peptidoglycan-associated protein